MNPSDLRIPGNDADWRRLAEEYQKIKRDLAAVSASVGRFGATFTTHGLNVEGDAHFSGDTTIDGDTTMGGTLGIDSDTTIGGSLDITGTTHISGNATIDGSTTIGGTLTLANGIVDPAALSSRSEGRTFGSSGTYPGSATFSRSITCTVPSWATATSCIAMATVYGDGLSTGVSIGGRVTIAGNAGPDSYVTTGGVRATCPMQHRRDWNPSGTFTVVASGGTSPTSGFDPSSWAVNVVVMCVFST